MTRAQPEMGYFEEGGTVRHGLIGGTPGRRIAMEEAKLICAQKRAQEPRSMGAGPAIDWSRVEALEAKVEGIKMALRELPSVVKGG